MKKALCPILFIALILVAAPAMADMAEEFKPIKIVDSIQFYEDIDGDVLNPTDLKAEGTKAFIANMRNMELNDDAWVNNYPAAGYKIENVGYMLFKLMDIKTASGMNVYHLHFEFGVPPRQVYWDTATMGIAPTTAEMKKEVNEDINEIMKSFADAFYKARGQ